MLALEKKIPIGNLILLAGWTCWLAWAPFEAKAAGEIHVALWTGDLETVGHMFLLVPFSLVLGFCWRLSRRARTWKTPLAFAVTLGLVAECGQWWITQRTISLDDILANTGGALAGFFLGTLISRRIDAPHLVSHIVLVSTFGLTLLWQASWMMRFGQGMEMKGWDASYPVVAGDEAGGGREYLGTISDAKLCAGIDEFGECVAAGAGIRERERLVKTVEKTREVLISASVISSSDHQKGPARILTFSRSTGSRNVTLGQVNRDLVFRFRSAVTGTNGGRIEFRLPEAVRMGELFKVSGQFHHGVVHVRSESETERHAGVFRPDLIGNSLSLHGWGVERIPRMIWGRSGPIGITLVLIASGYIGSAFAAPDSFWKVLSVPVVVAALWSAGDLLLLRIPIPETSGLVTLIALVFSGILLARFSGDRLLVSRKNIHEFNRH